MKVLERKLLIIYTEKILQRSKYLINTISITGRPIGL